MPSFEDLLARLSAQGDSSRRERIQQMLRSLSAGSAPAPAFGDNLARDSHWESLDELEGYVDRLLRVHESSGLDSDAHRDVEHETVMSCQVRYANGELPRPGDVDADPPTRLAHVFYKGDWSAIPHEDDVWEVLTTDKFNDPAKRAATLAGCADARIRAAAAWRCDWATFDRQADHPFVGAKFESASGAINGRAVVEAVGMSHDAGKQWAIACYSARRIGQIRMPTVCDGGWHEQFRVCGRSHPGNLPERLHRGLTFGDLDRKVLKLQ